MRNSAESDKIYDVIIIEAGHAGLSASYLLTKHKKDHLVIERGSIGESWKSRRWDSFKLNTPNWGSNLPGNELPASIQPDEFCTAGQFIDILKGYVKKFDLPVRENCEVLSLIKQDDLFRLELRGQQILLSKKVIVASGVSEGQLPVLSDLIPAEIFQLHAKDYKNPSQLPDGAVLVVGSGQSGSQIAEELLDHHKNVFLSSSHVASVPRRYRGKDVFYWLAKLKILDMPTHVAIENGQINRKQPQISGIGKYGHSINLPYLASKGGSIVGKIRSVENQVLHLDQNVIADLKFNLDAADAFKHGVDNFISSNDLDFPEEEPGAGNFSNYAEISFDNKAQLDLKENNIRSIIWATGFNADLSWIGIPAVKDGNQPIHVNGRSSEDGLYYIGFPWLRSRKSGIICGIQEDAEYLVQQVISDLAPVDITVSKIK